MYRIYKEEHPDTKDPMWLIAYGKNISDDDLKTGPLMINKFINSYPFPASGLTFLNTESSSIERTDIACSLMDIPSVLSAIIGDKSKIKAISWNSLSKKYVIALNFMGDMLKPGADYKYDGTGDFVGTDDIEDIRGLMNSYTGEENTPEIIEDIVENKEEVQKTAVQIEKDNSDSVQNHDELPEELSDSSIISDTLKISEDISETSISLTEFTDKVSDNIDNTEKIEPAISIDNIDLPATETSGESFTPEPDLTEILKDIKADKE